MTGAELIAQLIAYVGRFDARFEARIKGAPAEQIAEFVSQAAEPLPDTYSAFAERMGHSDGGFDFGHSAFTDIPHLIEYYREAEGQRADYVPPGFIVIGVWGNSVPNFCIAGGNEDGPVYTFDMPLPGKRTLLADSFGKLLFRYAFMKFEMNAMPYSEFYTGEDSRPLLASARELAVQEGFQPERFSDSITLCARRDQQMLVVHQTPPVGLWLRVSAADRTQAATAAEPFIDKFNLQFSSSRTSEKVS